MTRRKVVLAVGIGQTLTWASSYYLPAIFAAPMAADFGLSPSMIFGAFSLALLLAAVLGPAVGQAIDRRGGRLVLASSNVVLAFGLLLMAAAEGPAMLLLGWLVLGAGMAMGLYDAAFAALTALYGREARASITGVTLIAGFASTVGWPISAMLLDLAEWRLGCAIWAAANLAIGLPLHLVLPRAAGARSTAARDEPPEAPPRLMGWLLAGVFAANLFIAGAMSAHLPRMLLEAGATSVAAVGAAALVGPAQVLSRLLEFGLMRRIDPLRSAQVASLAHPVGAALLATGGGPMVGPFAALHGFGNGLLTVARGTLPLHVFGPAGYGARQGVLTMPGRILLAVAPLLYGLVLDGAGLTAALVLTAALSLCGALALHALARLRLETA